MQRSLTSLSLMFALAFHASPSAALGFGKVSGNATLGQALNFVVTVRVDPSEILEPACVKAEVSSGDRPLPRDLVRVQIEPAAARSAERRLHVLTTIAIDEPLVSVALNIGCPPSLARSFIVFADPPLRSATLSQESEPTLAGVPAAVPRSAASAPTRNAARPRAVAGKAASAASGLAATRGAASGAVAASARRSAAAPKSRPGAVLKLDSVEAEALVFPTLKMSNALGQVPDAVAPASSPRPMDPEMAQRLREQERLKALDDALVKLRTDNQATQKALGDMQERVAEAEAGHYANPLVYALLGLCALLAGVATLMWWLRRRDMQNGTWWSAQAEAVAAPPAPVAAEAPGTPAESGPAPMSTAASIPAPLPTAEDAARPRAALAVAPMPMVHAAPSHTPMPSRPNESSGIGAEPRRPMSAEELIDLEQQAEFFVVLGQDDAAIDLLMGHVRSTGGVSPLPYLKLLEIYRRRGEREAYDRIRERFNRRFNAYTPEWEVDPEDGLELEGYPEILKRLQKRWATPSQAMELLDSALFRRDAGPTFDVPAYRELLFLYGMARDLAERDIAPDSVDLLLPLGDDGAPAMTPVEASPVDTPSAPVTEPPVDPHFSLDFDLSIDSSKDGSAGGLTLEERKDPRKPR